MAHLRGADKRRYVADLFARISPRYDLMNSLMTGGLHHRWKRQTARLAAAGRAGPALDIATGTGDLAFAMARCPGVSAVVGVDLLPEMLHLAAAKRAAGNARRRSAAPVHLATGDALQLPFPDGAFICATAGFSLRNMPDVPAAIAEMARVVAPGGRVATLELTPMPPGIREKVGRIYFHKVVPLLGELVAGDPRRLHLPARQRGLLSDRRRPGRSVPAGRPGQRRLPPAGNGRRGPPLRRQARPGARQRQCLTGSVSF